MPIIDRRHKRDNTIENKKKFLNRQKKYIKEQLDKMIKDMDIKDIKKLNPKLKTKKSILKEPSLSYASSKGKRTIVSTGNDRYNKGQRIPVDRGGQGGGAGNSPETSQDAFEFTLTNKEFLDLFFDNCGLPNYTKKCIQELEKVFRRCGYSKEGTPPRINLKKTFENALARRIASKNTNARVPWIDDVDIRYNYFAKRYIPSRKAVMFCIMDVSGSMEKIHKLIAKKFYIILYLFLTKAYTNVEIVFIKHHTSASEVTEHQFFYDRETGGTLVSSALELTNEIIKERYNPSDWNIYAVQASDNENWDTDNDLCVSLLRNELLPKLQYFIYLNLRQPKQEMWDHEYGIIESLWTYYQGIKAANFAMYKLPTEDLIWHTFLDIFRKK